MKNSKFIITVFFLACSIFLLLIGCFVNGRGINSSVQGMSNGNGSVNYNETNLANFCVEEEINASLCHMKIELEDSNLQLNRVAYGIERPTSMAFLGYDDILVLERTKGTVQRILNGNVQNKPLLDVPVNYAVIGEC